MKNENQGPIRKDDPRITSYVLGERAELTNRECDEIRTLLDSDPELRAEVEGLSALAAELQAEMATEPGVELSNEQREAIAQAAGPPARSFMPRLVVGGALAASIAFGAFHLHRLTTPVRDTSQGDQLAQTEPHEGRDEPSSKNESARGEERVLTEVTHGLEDKASQDLGQSGRGSAGQNIAGNPTSGLSRYEGPQAEEAETMREFSDGPTSYDAAADGSPVGGLAPVDAEAPSLQLGRRAGKKVQADGDSYALTPPGGSGGGGGGGPSSPGPSGPSSPGNGGPTGSAGGKTATRGELGAGRPIPGGGGRYRGPASEDKNALGELSRLGYIGSESDDHFLRRNPSNNESYEAPPENRFTRVDDDPLSTFSIDVDTAGYANVRRFLTQGQRPPADAVRLEEMVNYFSYDYPQPVGNDPFSVSVETANCPWAEGHRLMQVGLKGKQFSDAREQGRNLVFLMDVSGSMNSPNKLPLLKSSFAMLLDHMSSTDRVAIVVYAGAAGVVLPSTQAANRGTIIGALNNLKAGGSTNGGAGIQLAYSIAQENFIQGGINRVILATDGDFNVGRTDRSSLVQMIEEKAKSGVYLTVLGYGMGNLKDATMEQLADKGNGNYAYIDNLNEARKVLVTEADATLETIAKDVKIQLEFNPGVVAAWRLVGYENRVLAHRDFNDDTKDAGEIGAGHTVTAIYEIVPVGMSLNLPGVDSLKYQRTQAPKELTDAAASGEMLTVKLRYKQPDGDTSQLIEVPVHDARRGLSEAPADFRFACAVAGFGMILKGSAYKGSLDLDLVRELALAGAERDPFGYRHEFLQLVERARQLGVK